MSATQHKEDTNYDERDTEQLSHVESHPSLEIHLLLLDEFHKETEGEDEGNAESEVEACSYGSPAVASLALIVINTYSYYKYNKVSQRLVELGRMSWRCHTIDQRFTCMEDKSPRHVSGHSYNLGIQEVADADATGSERSGYAHVVDHRHQFHSSAPRIEQHGDEAPECPTVTCQSGITAEVPTATRQYLYRKQHLDETADTAEVIPCIIEETMAESCPHKNTDEAVEKQGVELLVLYLLLPVQPLHYVVCRHESHSPHQGVPLDAERTDGESVQIRLPVYE